LEGGGFWFRFGYCGGNERELRYWRTLTAPKDSAFQNPTQSGAKPKPELKPRHRPRTPPEQDTCSFSGVWRGKPASMSRAYYVSSYLWDRALDAGIIGDKAAIEWKTSPAVGGWGVAVLRSSVAVGWMGYLMGGGGGGSNGRSLCLQVERGVTQKPLKHQNQPTPKPKPNHRPRPQEFAKRAAAVCGKDPTEVAKAYSLPEAHAPYFCLDLSFCHTVLTQGFDLSEAAPLTLVKQVVYNGQRVEAAWPLGAAIDALSAA